MTKSSTQDLLIRYAYGELPVLERLETEYLIEANTCVEEALDELSEGIAALPAARLQPSPAAMANILRYSRRPSLHVVH